ncbi:gustatory receptor for sugar taste 64e-like [Schistocerca cancellata]|uniref:gustatory receptor for sugar taste 64e-like n=1 Tax=Schistocerca cancellata TaxID=274614 RepID=UPI002119965D|nr:gustatory receptor for sugar taste 64e-like [Schistocerca cancellata]
MAKPYVKETSRKIFSSHKTWATPIKSAGASEADSFHRAVSWVLAMAQCFAIMPVHGVRDPSPHSLRFQWTSLRVIYAMFSLVGSTAFAVLSCLHMSSQGLTFSRTSPTVFFACSALASLLFLQLARDWPALAAAWDAVERRLEPRYGYPRGVARRCRLVTAAVLLSALVEHLLSNAPTAVETYYCSPSGFAFLRIYFTSKYYYVLDYLGYNFAVNFCTAFISIIATFAWNYVDLFIILLSIAITERFKQINIAVKSCTDKVVGEREWRQLRLDYNSLAQLTKTVDRHVNKIVLLSFATNLYFVCLQFLHSTVLQQAFLLLQSHIFDLPPLASAVETVYYYWSFIYLFAKTCLVSLSASDIYVRSKEPSTLLYSVPPLDYSSSGVARLDVGEGVAASVAGTDGATAGSAAVVATATCNYLARPTGIRERSLVERFLSQVTSDHVALTGLNFFPVTRTLLLTVAGTIVTYEIVLVQLNAPSDVADVAGEESGNRTALCETLRL